MINQLFSLISNFFSSVDLYWLDTELLKRHQILRPFDYVSESNLLEASTSWIICQYLQTTKRKSWKELSSTTIDKWILYKVPVNKKFEQPISLLHDRYNNPTRRIGTALLLWFIVSMYISSFFWEKIASLWVSIVVVFICVWGLVSIWIYFFRTKSLTWKIVQFENTTFENSFDVRCNDWLYARTIFTPEIIDQLILVDDQLQSSQTTRYLFIGEVIYIFCSVDSWYSEDLNNKNLWILQESKFIQTMKVE